MSLNSTVLIFLLLKFHLKLASSQCADTLTGQSGVIKSPGYPAKYPTSTNCRWYVVVFPGQRISFTLRDLNIVNSAECQDDRLEIHGLITPGHESEVFCGTQKSRDRPFTSKGHQTDVAFTSAFRILTSTQSGFMLTYEAIGCQSPPRQIKSAKLIDVVDYYEEGSSSRYKCPKGMMFKTGLPERVSVCLPKNQWQHWSDTCIAITCAPPVSTTGVKHRPVQEVYRLGSQVSFSCDDHLNLVGSSILVCTDSAHWSASTPICEGKPSCSMPPEPQNGRLISVAVEIGGHAVFACDIGYRLDGAEKILCQSNTQWNPAPPVCAHITCPPLQATNGSHLIIERVDDEAADQSQAWYGSRVLYSCEQGYALSNGNITRQCGKTGLWDGVEPTCAKIVCPMPAIPEHGYHHVEKLEPGSKAVFGCNDGYELVGHSQVTCLQDGTWSVASPLCTELPPKAATTALAQTTSTTTTTTHAQTTITTATRTEQTRTTPTSTSTEPTSTSTPLETTTNLDVNITTTLALFSMPTSTTTEETGTSPTSPTATTTTMTTNRPDLTRTIPTSTTTESTRTTLTSTTTESTRTTLTSTTTEPTSTSTLLETTNNLDVNTTTTFALTSTPISTGTEPTNTSMSHESTTTEEAKTTVKYGGDGNVDAIVAANSNSTGRNVGIGVGLLVLVLLIIAVIYFIIQKRRAESKPKTVESDFENPTYDALSGSVQLRKEDVLTNGVTSSAAEPWSRNPTYRNAVSVINTRPDSVLVDNEELIYGNSTNTFR